MERDPSLVATCDEGLCAVVDLHDHPAAQCEASDECRVRTRDCCECGGGTGRGDLIGIRADAAGDYPGLVCDRDEACPECAPVYPEEAEAECTAEGYCTVTWPEGR
jgi:hypothetical protein